MPPKTRLLFRYVSLALILAAAALLGYAWASYHNRASLYPAGLTIAGVPVGGLDRQTAADRITAVYACPVELHYENALIQVTPAELGFSLRLDDMLSQADAAASLSFWDSLWNRASGIGEIPLAADVSDETLRAYLVDEISARYDRPAQSALPRPADPVFTPGSEGTVMDVDQAVSGLRQALTSPTDRVVTLAVSAEPIPRLDFANLQILLEQIIQTNGYSGLAEIYVQDLATGEVIDFALNNDQAIQPDVAFSAASIIKIPIMVSVYRRLSDPIPEADLTLLERMIEESDNTASDQLAQDVLDVNLAPNLVTADMRALGLQNTFWSGFFYLGAPLLDIISTPANQRTDINTNPDIYSQITPADAGWLLGEIYRCAKDGSGALTTTFPGEITSGECQQMIDLLLGNHMPQLVQGGIPDGVRFAHKHGWAVDASDGLLHNLADAGIAFTGGGDYVMTVFFHQTDQLLFDPNNDLIGTLGQAVYDYFQTPQ